MDRKLEFYAWGKQNLAQFPSSELALPTLQATEDPLSEEKQVLVGERRVEGAGPNLVAPCPLVPLPHGHTIAEVWCGSEFTLAADEAGGLWACGWNEHGNCGVGSHQVKQAAVVGQWTRVKGCVEDVKCNAEGGLQLSHVWEGAVACGGGHVLCLP